MLLARCIKVSIRVVPIPKSNNTIDGGRVVVLKKVLPVRRLPDRGGNPNYSLGFLNYKMQIHNILHYLSILNTVYLIHVFILLLIYITMHAQ